MTKILYFHNSPVRGGAGIVFRDQIKELKKHGISPVIACVEGPMAAEFRKLGLPVEIIDSPSLTWTLNPLKILLIGMNYICLVKRLLKMIRQYQVELIHCNTIKSAIYGSAAARLAGIPCIWHAHSILKKRLVNRLLCALINPRPGQIIAVSRAVRNRLEELGIAASRIEVIYNGLDLEQWSPQNLFGQKFRRDQQIKDDVMIFTMIGAIAAMKGQHIFIEAAKELLAKQQNALFLIVGRALLEETKYQKLLEKKLAEINSKNIILLGECDKLPEIYAASNVIVVPSILPDSLPTVILEAMAMGRPVIASSIGGIPEMVVDGLTGFLVRPNDAGALVERMEYFMVNRCQGALLGDNARKRLESEFNLNTTADKIMMVYAACSQARKK